jgi:hypothetical protein
LEVESKRYYIYNIYYYYYYYYYYYSDSFHNANFIEYFIAVTIHFITNDWELRNFPAAFKKVDGAHTGEAIGNIVANILKPLLGIAFSQSRCQL